MKSSSPHIVVLSANPVSHSQTDNLRGGTQICWVRDWEALEQEAQSHPVDGLVVDQASALEPSGVLAKALDFSPTVVITGNVPLIDAAAKLQNMLDPGVERPEPLPNHKNITLEDYVESKFSEFVKAMKVSSARSLHNTLIRAVERPLIKLALQETNGNQIQAAQLLGMNRNTLRKKIVELKIPVKRRSPGRPERTPA